jgi:hypothetical protein
MTNVANKVYTATPNPIDPLASNNDSRNANAEGSHFGAAPYSATEQALLNKFVFKQIIEASREQFMIAAKLIFSNPVVQVGSREYSWWEHQWPREAVEFQGLVGANPLSWYITGTFSAANPFPFSVQDVIGCAGSKVQVATIVYTGIANTSYITVTANLNYAAPTPTLGDKIKLETTLIGDAQNFRSHYDRAKVSERYNFLMSGDRTARWGRQEMLEWKNNARTDFLDFDKQNTIRQLQIDIFSNLWQSKIGEFQYTVPGGGTYSQRTINGIKNILIDAGSPNPTVSQSGSKAMFMALAEATNYYQEGHTRMIFGSHEKLTAFSTEWKNPVQYAPTDEIAKLGLKRYEIGSMNFVPVACEMFRKDSEVFPDADADKIYCLDMASISPCQMEGLPMLEVFPKTLNKREGGINDFDEWTVQYNIGLQFKNPLGSFSMTIV